MRIDELTRELHEARAHEPAADVSAGRDAVARAVRRHETRRVGAVALVVLVLLGGFAATVSRVGARDQGSATSTEGLPRLIPTDLPDGLRLKLLATEPSGLLPFTINNVHVSVFAKPGAVAPADSFVVTRVQIGSTARGGTTQPSPPMDPAAVETDNDGTRLTGRTEADGSTVVVTTQALTAAELTAITRGVRFLPTGEADPTSVPSGYEPKVSDARTWWLANNLYSITGEAGYVQIYAAPDPSRTAGTPGFSNPLGSNTEKSLALSASTAGPQDIEAARWMLPKAADRTVRGHRAVTGSYAVVSISTVDGEPLSGRSPGAAASSGTVPPAGSSDDPNVRRTVVGSYQVLAWMENDTTLVQLASANYSADELARIAEGLRVDPSDFRDLRAATTTSTLGENCTPTADGGSVCRSFGTSGGGGSGSCVTAQPPATGSVTDQRRSAASFDCQATPITPEPSPTTSVVGGAPTPPDTASARDRTSGTTSP